MATLGGTASKASGVCSSVRQVRLTPIPTQASPGYRHRPALAATAEQPLVQTLRPASLVADGFGLLRLTGSRTGRRQNTCIQLGRGFTAAMGTEMRRQLVFVIQRFSFIGSCGQLLGGQQPAQFP